MNIPSPIVLRMVCAWCMSVITEGSADAPVSHGICDWCFDLLTADANHADETAARAVRVAIAAGKQI